MKKVKIYGVLINGRTGAEVKKVYLHTAMMDEGRISLGVYNRIWSKVGKMELYAIDHGFSATPMHHHWELVTEDGRKPTGCRYGAYVRFE
jgi:hypothetical protein